MNFLTRYSPDWPKMPLTYLLTLAVGGLFAIKTRIDVSTPGELDQIDVLGATIGE